MASDFTAEVGTSAVGTSSPGKVLARLDRINVWALPPVFLIVLGVGFLFTFYDIFDINVSFIQTCTQIVAGCTPASASQSIGLPTLLNLTGYVIGALALTTIADRWGRRNTLLLTLVVTGLGSLYSAFTNDIINFDISRLITGIGIGADLAIVNTYIGEVAPAAKRARFTSLIFIMSALGAVVGIWLGLILTTASTPFPLGLSFAQAGPSFSNGWRWMYGVGAILALIGILMRFELPESPRWLLASGQIEEAEKTVAAMEKRAAAKEELAAVTEGASAEPEKNMGYGEIFSNPVYVRRSIILLAVWLLGYVTIYVIAAGFTSVLASLGYPPPEAGLVAAVGTLGFVLAAIFAALFGERLERKFWLPIMAVVTIIGCVLIAIAGKPTGTETPWVTFIGAVVLFFGFNAWVPITYAWSAESYPTRARVTGFGLVDGVGHISGGIGVALLVPVLPQIGVGASFLVIGGFLVAAAIVAQFGSATRGRQLDEVSP